MKKINTCNKPGKPFFFLRSEINTCNQPGQLSHRPTFFKFQINTCNKPGKNLWTTDCRLIPETRQDNYLLDHHEATLHRFLPFQDAVLHRLIIRQPYTGSFFQLTKLQLYKLQVCKFTLRNLLCDRQSSDGIYNPIPRQDSVTSPNGIYKPILLPTISRWNL